VYVWSYCGPTGVGGAQDAGGDGVAFGRRGHGQRQPADGAPLLPVHELAGIGPIGAADVVEHGLRHGRLLPASGMLVLVAPDVAQRFPGDPEAAAAIVEDDAAAARAVEPAGRIDERADRPGAGIHEIALPRCEAGAVGNLHVAAEAHDLRVDVQRVGQPALQQFVLAAEARQAGLHAFRHAVHERIGRQRGKGGAHGVAAVRGTHLQGGQARDAALGDDGAAGRGERPAGLGAAGVDAEPEARRGRERGRGRL
jgi:hypothetical protein